MTEELRKLIYFTFELILLGAIVAVVALSATVGRASLNNFIDAHDARVNLPEVVAYSKGSVGYYELVDLIDSYASTAEVEISYPNDLGGTSVLTFTSATTNGKNIRLAVGSEAPEYGIDYTGEEYSRQSGKLYRNGVEVPATTLEVDMKIPTTSLNGLDDLYGNGVLDYEFVERLFNWAKDERFICTVTQLQDTSRIERITLQMQK